MRSTERRALIVDRVNRDGSVKIREIVDELHVAAATVRRDIQELADQGLVERIHGGAVKLPMAPSYQGPTPPAAKFMPFVTTAIDYIEPGMTVGLCGGDIGTALMAKLCQSNLAADLKVVAYSLDVVRVATEWGAEQRGMTLLFPGGILHDNMATGEYASRFLADIRMDVAFLHPEGVDKDGGCMVNDPVTAPTIQTFMKHARSLVGLIPQDLWHSPGFVSVCPLGKLDIIITRGDVPSFMLPFIQTGNIEIREAQGRS